MRPNNLLASFFDAVIRATVQAAETRLRTQSADTSRRGVRAMQRRAMNAAERASGIPKAFRQHARRHGSDVNAVQAEIKKAASRA